jgi:hypothetical protein
MDILSDTSAPVMDTATPVPALGMATATVPLSDMPAVVVETPSPTDELVDAWFVETFHNLGPQLSDQMLARFIAARDVLKARLR